MNDLESATTTVDEPTDTPKPPEGIGVALSGGGVRATLFSLGALMFLVDSGLNRLVREIASVSGGSITNAYVAQRCDFACGVSPRV